MQKLLLTSTGHWFSGQSVGLLFGWWHIPVQDYEASSVTLAVVCVWSVQADACAGGYTAVSERSLAAASPPPSAQSPVVRAVRHEVDWRWPTYHIAASFVDTCSVAGLVIVSGLWSSVDGVSGRRWSIVLHGPLGGAGARRRACGATAGRPSRIWVRRQG